MTVRERMPLSGPAKRQPVGRWMSKCEYSAHLYLPVGHVVRAVSHAAKRSGGRACVYVGHSYRKVHVGMRGHGPWILRNCPTFSAAPRICVSFDTRRIKFASVIRSDVDLVDWVGAVE